IARRSKNAWQLSAQEAQALTHGNATLQQEGADLIDDASALTDQLLTHPVERLQIELLGGLCRDELHGRALHRLGDRLGVAEVVLLSLGIRAHVLRRHQPSVVSEHPQLAAKMMRPNAPPCRLDTAASWPAVLPPARVTTSAGARLHHIYRAPPRGMSSCRYRYQSR